MTTALARALGGRYRLERELGAGGMATVYLARDLKHDRDVALKVMRPELAQSLGADRFLREITLAARLTHPHILPLFDSGDAGGALWYAMPVITGESLRDRLDRDAQLPVAEAVRIATEVAGALDFAHRQGVVHRDIKPENILLQDGHALVADFGIGKAIGEAETAEASVTATGISVGTPAYMSPEQAVGEAVDGRSDLYSLGCVLYELLVGEPPFTGPNPQAVIAKRFVQTPADVQALREGVPRPVARALQQVLQRTPIDRFETGAAFAAAINDGMAAAQQANVAPDASIAVLPFASLADDRENEFFGDGLAEDITNALASVAGLFVAGRQSVGIYKGRTVPVATIGRELGVAHVLQGSVRRAGTRVRITAQLVAVADGYQLWSERYDRELTDIFAVQDEIAGAIAERLALRFAKASAPVVATARDLEVYELVARGRALIQVRGRPVLEAMQCFEQALALAPDHVPALAGLAASKRIAWQYGFRPVQPTLADAEQLLLRALQLEPTHAETLATLAVLRINEGDWSGFDYWRDAIERDPRLAEARALYGVWGLMILGQGRDDAEGERHLRIALERDPLSPVVATIGGLGLAMLRKFDESDAVLRRAIGANPDSFATRYAHAWMLTWARRHEAALAATHEGMERFGRHPWFLQTLPGIFLGLGERGKADAVWAELEARTVTSHVPHFARAIALCYLGRTDDAMAEAIASAHANDAIGPIWFRWFDLEPLMAHPRYPELLRACMQERPA